MVGAIEVAAACLSIESISERDWVLFDIRLSDLRLAFEHTEQAVNEMLIERRLNRGQYSRA